MVKKISIEYCVEWDYYPQAASLAAAIEKEYGIKPQLIRSGGGVFEVEADGVLIFSKKEQFRFPAEKEIIDQLQNRWWESRVNIYITGEGSNWQKR